KNIFNYSVSTAVLLFNDAVTFYILINLKIDSDPLIDVYLNIVGISVGIIWGMIFFSTFVNKIIGSNKFSQFDKKLEEKNIENPILEDTKRKFFHISFYLLVWLGVVIMSVQTLLFIPVWAEPELYQEWIWGYHPGELFFFLRYIGGITTLLGNAAISILFWFLFMIGGFISATIEAIRHSKLFYSPTSHFVIFLARKKEINALASHFYLFISFSFAAYILPPLLTISVIGIVCIADSAASIFGIRFGKKKIRINPKKTWVGTAAGTISAFIITSIFIGLLYGIITAFIFMIIDIFTEKPINISDNLSVPVILTLVYVTLNLLGFFYVYPPFLYV
ncbi:MAG: phosphatidate cytidylyltransferase, partial [Promethearchaeota archaeon]